MTQEGLNDPAFSIRNGNELIKLPCFTLFSPHFDDNIILFTDGMANEGVTDTWDLVKEVQKRIQGLKKEHRYPDDYGIRLCTLGTGGFLPEMIFELGQAFSSDAFHFLDETNNLEISLFRPLYLRFLAIVHKVKVKVTVLNGVEFDLDEMYLDFKTVEEELLEDHSDSDDSDNNKAKSSESSPDSSPTHKGKSKSKKKKKKKKKTNNKSDKKNAKNAKKEPAPVKIEMLDEHVVQCNIHDIGRELQRHILTVLKLPKKHHKVLKDKPVMKIEIQCRDIQYNVHTLEDVILYKDLPLNNDANKEPEVTIVAQHQNRLTAVKCLEKSAWSIKKLDRINARETLASGTNNIQVTDFLWLFLVLLKKARNYPDFRLNFFHFLQV